MESFPPKLSRNLIKLIMNNFALNLYKTHKLKNKKLWAYFLRRPEIDYFEFNDQNKFVVSLTGDAHTSYVYDLILLPNNTLLSASFDNSIKQWSPDDLTCLKTYTDHGCPVFSLLLMDEFLVSGDTYGNIFLWTWTDMALKQKEEVHSDWIWTLVRIKSSKSPRVFVSGSRDKSMKLFKIEDSKLVNLNLTLTGHTDFIRAVLELEDGHLMSGSDDNSIKLWNRDEDLTYKFSRNLENGHTCWVWDLIQLSNKDVASASLDQTIKIWSFKDEFKSSATLKFVNLVTSLLELKDGKLLSGGLKEVVVWDLKSMKEIYRLSNTHGNTIYSMVMMKDNLRVVTCSQDYKVKMLNKIQ